MTSSQALKFKRVMPETTFGMLIILMVISVLLSVAFPFTIFSPVPLTIAFLLFGRWLTWLFALIFASTLWYVSSKYLKVPPEYLTSTYVVVTIVAALISEVINFNVNPSKGLVLAGAGFALLLSLAIVGSKGFDLKATKTEIQVTVDKFIEEQKEKKANKELIASGTEEGKMFEKVISRKGEISDMIFNYLPSIIVVMAFFSVWTNLFTVLGISKIWRYKKHYEFTRRDLVAFKTPDFFIYPLIVALVLVIGDGHFVGKTGVLFGGNFLYSLGIFFLFQGFGIYYDFLTFARIGGFFKSILILITIISAYQFLALLGMFDMWINFRKFFIKKNNEGDMI